MKERTIIVLYLENWLKSMLFSDLWTKEEKQVDGRIK